MEKEKKNELSGLTPSQEAKVCKKMTNTFKKMKAEFEKNEREKGTVVEKVIAAVNGLSVGEGITVIGAAVGLIVKNADPNNENHTTERTISKLTTIVCNTIVQLSQKKEDK